MPRVGGLDGVAVTATHKRCRGCGEEKETSAFSRVRKAEPTLRSRCRDCDRQAFGAWQRAHRPERNAYMREWKAKNADARTAWERAWLERHPDYKRRWREAHAEEQREYFRKWREENRAKCRQYTATRRARVNAVYVEEVDPLVVFERDEGVCGICHEAVDPSVEWHVDHIRPIARGGVHSYANVQLAHPACNKRKGAKWPTS